MSEEHATKAADSGEQVFPHFVGWMLWNIVRQQHVSRGTPWICHRDAIFEDQPENVQTAWNRAAADLQQRAKVFGRLA